MLQTKLKRHQNDNETISIYDYRGGENEEQTGYDVIREDDVREGITHAIRCAFDDADAVRSVRYTCVCRKSNVRHCGWDAVQSCLGR